MSPRRFGLGLSLLFSLLTPTMAFALDPQLPAMPRDMADLFTVEEDGSWFCGPDPDDTTIHNNTVCPNKAGVGQGSSSAMAVKYLILTKSKMSKKLVPKKLKMPKLLRVGKARNNCPVGSHGADCATGVPTMATCTPPRKHYGVDISTPYCALVTLKRKNIALGVIMGSKKDGKPDGEMDGRTTAEMAYQACKIRKADKSKLYDFLFIDQAHYLGSRESKVVSHITRGEVEKAGGSWKPCLRGARGWAVITNDNGVSDSRLDTVAYAHTHALSAVGSESNENIASDAANDVDPLSSDDYDFVHAVNALSHPTTAILRLEVVAGTSNFGTWLNREQQCSLLYNWAKHQDDSSRDRFTLIYPYYVHGGAGGPSTYDSKYRGTSRRVLELMGKFQEKVTYSRDLSDC